MVVEIAAVGIEDGRNDDIGGPPLGAHVVGRSLGVSDGRMLGRVDGSGEGGLLGFPDGDSLGANDGISEGAPLGSPDGLALGSIDGIRDGW